MITLGEGGLGQFSLLSGLGYALTRGIRVLANIKRVEQKAVSQ